MELKVIMLSEIRDIEDKLYILSFISIFILVTNIPYMYEIFYMCKKYVDVIVDMYFYLLNLHILHNNHSMILIIQVTLKSLFS